MASDLNEKTNVPLFAVIAAATTVVPMMIGGIMWLTSIDSKASNALQANAELASKIKENEDRNTSHYEELRAFAIDNNNRLIRIESKITK